MPKLFGLDIAKMVDKNIQLAGGVLNGTLTKVSNTNLTPGALTGPRNPTSASHPVRGFVEKRTTKRRAGTLIEEGGEFVSILGNSLPSGVEPGSGDTVTMEGVTYKVIKLEERDPAGALFVLRVEG